LSVATTNTATTAVTTAADAANDDDELSQASDNGGANKSSPIMTTDDDIGSCPADNLDSTNDEKKTNENDNVDRSCDNAAPVAVAVTDEVDDKNDKADGGEVFVRFEFGESSLEESVGYEQSDEKKSEVQPFVDTRPQQQVRRATAANHSQWLFLLICLSVLQNLVKLTQIKEKE